MSGGMVQRLGRRMLRVRRRLAGRRGSFILLYHRTARVIGDPWSLCVSPEHFAQHMRVLRERCSPVWLTDLARAAENGIPDGACVVTFDDGYADNLEHALPALVAYDIPATVFLATGYVGRGAPFWWDELERILLAPPALPPALIDSLAGLLGREPEPVACAAQASPAEHPRHARGTHTPREALFTDAWRALGRLPGPEREGALAQLGEKADVPPSDGGARALTRDELRALGSSGHVDFGAHTVWHGALPELSVADQRAEVVRSRDDVRALTGEEASTFSYPHGRFDERTVALVREAGFAIACTVAHHPPAADLTTAPWHPMLVPRVHVFDWNAREFERRLLDGFRG